ncbi:F-box family protein [Rhynchospora pubera]|uniref:F-box family protein n=1 Tax=Rhynchospora pubera TaxID=906938 RepID=A0AAV8GJM6_9POAL|nr:F-box family protein [Rhynchospora pubera]
MEGAPSRHPDWAYLPQLVLHWISEKLKSVTDFVIFRAVCPSWRSAPLPKPRHLPPQLPWLMIAHKQNADKNDDGMRFFYDLWKGKMHMLYLPEIIDKGCCATHRGWLLVIATKGTEVFLLNPLTRDRTYLPPFTTPVRYLGEEWHAPLHDTPFQFSPSHEFRYSKVILSSDLTDPDCLITVFLHRLVIFCCRVGDPCWTMVNSPLNYCLHDVTYYNGRFYLLYDHDEPNKGDIVIIDSDEPDKPIEYNFEPELWHRAFHEMSFMEGHSGVYLIGCKEDEYELYRFHEQPMRLELITDTSNITIFNTHNFYFLAVCSDDWDKLRAFSMCTVCYAPDQETDGYYYSICYAKREDGKMAPLWDLDEEPLVLAEPKEPLMWLQPSFV